jgi:hypothetical protein
VGTKPEDIPDELVRAVFLNRGLEGSASLLSMIRSDIEAAVDWLREHPAEAARLLGTPRTPTSWDV